MRSGERDARARNSIKQVTDQGEGAGSASEEHGDRSKADERIDQDNLSELIGPEAVDEDEQDEADVLEVDQTELDELGLTLDDPHQPTDE